MGTRSAHERWCSRNEPLHDHRGRECTVASPAGPATRGPIVKRNLSGRRSQTSERIVLALEFPLVLVLQIASLVVVSPASKRLSSDSETSDLHRLRPSGISYASIRKARTLHLQPHRSLDPRDFHVKPPRSYCPHQLSVLSQGVASILR